MELVLCFPVKKGKKCEVSALFRCRETRERKGSSRYLYFSCSLDKEQRKRGVEFCFLFLKKIFAICYEISSYILGDLEGKFKFKVRYNQLCTRYEISPLYFLFTSLLSSEPNRQKLSNEFSPFFLPFIFFQFSFSSFLFLLPNIMFLLTNT